MWHTVTGDTGRPTVLVPGVGLRGGLSAGPCTGMGAATHIGACLAAGDYDGMGTPLGVQHVGGVWSLIAYEPTGERQHRIIHLNGGTIAIPVPVRARRVLGAASRLGELAEYAPRAPLLAFPAEPDDTGVVRDEVEVAFDVECGEVPCVRCWGRVPYDAGGLCLMCASTGKVNAQVSVSVSDPFGEVESVGELGVGTVDVSLVVSTREQGGLVTERSQHYLVRWTQWWDRLLEPFSLTCSDVEEFNGDSSWCFRAGAELVPAHAIAPTRDVALHASTARRHSHVDDVVTYLRGHLRDTPGVTEPDPLARWGLGVDGVGRVLIQQLGLRAAPTVEDSLGDLTGLCHGGYELTYGFDLRGGVVPTVRVLDGFGEPLCAVANGGTWQVALMSARDTLLAQG